jgi:hypothetical protein
MDNHVNDKPRLLHRMLYTAWILMIYSFLVLPLSFLVFGMSKELPMIMFITGIVLFLMQSFIINPKLKWDESYPNYRPLINAL